MWLTQFIEKIIVNLEECKKKNINSNETII